MTTGAGTSRMTDRQHNPPNEHAARWRVAASVAALLCALGAREATAQEPAQPAEAGLTAASSSSPKPTPTPAPDRTLSLISEEVQVAGAKPQQAFWWRDVSAPAWTETDRALQQALQARGVTLTAPPTTARLSRIYKVPALGARRGALLGALLGATRAVVGQVTYRVEPARTPLGLHRCEVAAQVHIVLASASGDARPKRVTVRRVLFDADPAKVLQRARAAMTRALALHSARVLLQRPSTTGVFTEEEPLIVLRGAVDQRAVDAIRRAMVALQPVRRVSMRWATEGSMALEINPGRADDEAVFTAIQGHLTAQPIEGVRLELIPTSAHAYGARARVFQVRRAAAVPVSPEPAAPAPGVASP